MHVEEMIIKGEMAARLHAVLDGRDRDSKMPSDMAKMLVRLEVRQVNLMKCATALVQIAV